MLLPLSYKTKLKKIPKKKKKKSIKYNIYISQNLLLDLPVESWPGEFKQIKWSLDVYVFGS